jgi:hypothetical protein
VKRLIKKSDNQMQFTNKIWDDLGTSKTDISISEESALDNIKTYPEAIGMVSNLSEKYLLDALETNPLVAKYINIENLKPILDNNDDFQNKLLDLYPALSSTFVEKKINMSEDIKRRIILYNFDLLESMPDAAELMKRNYDDFIKRALKDTWRDNVEKRLQLIVNTGFVFDERSVVRALEANKASIRFFILNNMPVPLMIESGRIAESFLSNAASNASPDDIVKILSSRLTLDRKYLDGCFFKYCNFTKYSEIIIALFEQRKYVPYDLNLLHAIETKEGNDELASFYYQNGMIYGDGFLKDLIHSAKNDAGSSLYSLIDLLDNGLLLSADLYLELLKCDGVINNSKIKNKLPDPLIQYKEKKISIRQYYTLVKGMVRKEYIDSNKITL